MHNRRIHARKFFQKECLLSNGFNLLEAQTVDISKMGLCAETNKTMPYKNGSELSIFIPYLRNFGWGKLVWTKKNSNNTTRLGFKISTNFH